MHAFTTELNTNSIPGRHIVAMAGLPFSKSLMILDDTPRISFYSTRYGAKLGVSVSIPDSMKEGILGASAAIFPNGSAMAVISSIGILVCPFPDYLVEAQYHAGSLASIVGSSKSQREEKKGDTEEKTDQPMTCVDFRCFEKANLKDALTSAEGEIPKACNDWPMIPGAVREGDIRLLLNNKPTVPSLATTTTTATSDPFSHLLFPIQPEILFTLYVRHPR